MKLCAAQFKSTKGNILKNIERHLNFVNTALERDADAIFFPELSLTGYEPALAKDLAIHQDDRRLGIFQRVSDEHHLIIGVGVPTQSKSGVLISMIFFSQLCRAKFIPNKFCTTTNCPTLHVASGKFF
jgi:predicted amidohydrolase